MIEWSELGTCLKKDDNAHFTYNLGVGLLRFALFLFGGAVVFVILYTMQVGNDITFQEKVQVSKVTNGVVERKVKHYRKGHSYTETITEYYRTFYGTYENGRELEYKQQIGKKAYREQSDNLEFKKPVEYNLYVGPYNRKYITDKEGKKAAKEFQQVNTTPFLVFVKYAYCALGIGAFVFASLGFRQQKLSKKYPRTDGYDLIKRDRILTEQAKKEAEFDRQMQEYKNKNSADYTQSEHRKTEAEIFGKMK